LDSNASRASETSAAHGNARAGAAASFDFWRIAHRALRGRQRFVMAITAGGALVGAGIGLLVGQRLYSATGLVRVASTLPAVLKETDQNRPMAMFEGFIQAQRQVMSGREVIDAAMKDPAWQKLGRRAPSAERFASSLKIETRPRSDFLQVKVTHPDPAVAAAGVQSVIAAYKQVFTKEQERAEGSRMEVLQQRRSALTDEQAKLEAKIKEISRGRTLTEIEPLCQEVSDRTRKLRSALTDIQIAIAGGPGLYPQAWDAHEQTASASDPAQWYSIRMARLERELLEARAAGLRDAHPTVVRIQNAISNCRAEIAALPPVAEAPHQDTVISEATRKPLQERETSLRDLLQAAQDEMTQLAAEREQLKRLDERVVAMRQQLTDTESRLDALSTEATLGGRLMVVSGGERPMTAMTDNRIKTGIAGIMFGGAVPFGLLMLGTLVRRRYRTGEEVAEDLAEFVPFVAVLPRVDGPGAVAGLAARCIHDVRARLRPKDAEGPRVYMVTSAAPGEGKSAIALSLGLSFAAAGCRTIVVDGDLSTRGLTLSFGAGTEPGLLEAITAGTEPAIRRLRSGLCVLTAGKSAPQDACRIVAGTLRKVLASLRERFDVVIIDADSTLTGVTSSVVAPQADGVILAVASGQQPYRARQAAQQLSMLGTTLSTAVFNWADPAQFPADMLASFNGERTLPDAILDFGPLVAGVFESLSLTREEDVRLAGGMMELARPDATPGERGHEAHRQVRSAA
jgi:Mrp family chromosome partitioning ATPase/uncharacterized protein involved in exopolysaccharide biosynthesis